MESEIFPSKAKISQTYRVADPIANFKIRLRIAQRRSKLAELFENEEDTRDNNFLQYDERVFAWQEKVLARFEVEFYSVDKNCANETQRNYRRFIIDDNVQGSRLYTYVNDDSYFSDQTTLTEPRKSYLGIRNNLALPTVRNRKPFGERYNKKVVEEIPGDNRIRVNHYLYRDNEVMRILADLTPNDDESYGFNDSQVLLCEIVYDKNRCSLNVNPDFTTDLPYEVRGKDMSYDYWIEHASETRSNEELEEEIKELRDEVMRKLSFREAEIFPEIKIPPSNVLRLFVNLDIVSAHNFPYDSLFVTYNVELPENWSTNKAENLSGRTQRCSMRKGAANFGYVAEFSLDLNLSRLEDEEFSPPWPLIFISIASLDSWTRYRIEGYAAQPIPANSGSYDLILNTWRPIGDFLNTLRRFFTGGTCELQDISYCGIPASMRAGSKLEKSNLETAPSGQVKLKLNIVHQSRFLLTDAGLFKRDNFERLSAGRLMNSVNDVLQQFKAARERMIRARITSL